MVGGHLDSWIAGTGATDDGAGVIIAMEAMRILNALHVQPRRTIRIALWSGEEQGEFGSLGYVHQHFATIGLSTKPEQLVVPEYVRERVGPLTVKPEHGLISGYFNLDNGGGKVLGIYAENNAAIVPIFNQWIAPLKDLGVTTVSMRNTGSTDHESFNEVGIPGFQFIQDPRDYETRSLHSNQDVYERLSATDLKQAAVVEAIFLYNTAMRDQMLPRKPLPIRRFLIRRISRSRICIPAQRRRRRRSKEGKFVTESSAPAWARFRCTNGRQCAGDQGGEQKAAHHGHKNEGVEWTGSVQDGSYERGCRRATGHADEQAKQDRAQAIEQHQAQYLRSLRAQCDANANLRDALGDEIRQHSIKADRCEQHQHGHAESFEPAHPVPPFCYAPSTTRLIAVESLLQLSFSRSS